MTPPGAWPPHPIGPVNWIGLWTLYTKEVQRFRKVQMQTIWAPMVTSLLFYAVFALALGGAVREIGGVPFMAFLGPGLVMMAITQNAFANTSSSIIIAKVQGNIVDILMPPLAPWEFVLGYILGGVSRGLLVGAITGLVIWALIDFRFHDGLAVLFYAAMASFLMAMFGLIGGIWSDKFDHIATVTNFVVTPLAFLSGTFYSVDVLPTPFWWAAHLNPMFYVIDGFRYGFLGQADSPILLGASVLVATNLALWALCLRMVATGYKLKA